MCMNNPIKIREEIPQSLVYLKYQNGKWLKTIINEKSACGTIFPKSKIETYGNTFWDEIEIDGVEL